MFMLTMMIMIVTMTMMNKEARVPLSGHLADVSCLRCCQRWLQTVAGIDEEENYKVKGNKVESLHLTGSHHGCFLCVNVSAIAVCY